MQALKRSGPLIKMADSAIVVVMYSIKYHVRTLPSGLGVSLGLYRLASSSTVCIHMDHQSMA